MNGLRQVGIALDQLLNAVCHGWADETLSARAWRNRGKGGKWALLLVVFNGLFFWQKNHCRGAYNMEQERNHLPAEYRVTQ